MDSHFSSSSPMPIDVPLGDMSDSVLGHNQLTTIDHSELSAQLGLGLGGSVMLSRSKSPEQPLSATPSPAGSLQDEDMDDFRQVSIRNYFTLHCHPSTHQWHLMVTGEGCVMTPHALTLPLFPLHFLCP